MIAEFIYLPVSTLCCGVDRPRRLMPDDDDDDEWPPFANIGAIISQASRNTFFDAFILCCSISIIIVAIAENNSDEGKRRSIRTNSLASFELIKTAAQEGKISIRGGTFSVLPLFNACLHFAMIAS